MKKIVALLLAVLSIGLYAGEEDAPTPADEYTIFQLGFFLDQPSMHSKEQRIWSKGWFSGNERSWPGIWG